MSKRKGYVLKMASGQYLHVVSMVKSSGERLYTYLPGVYDYACLTLLSIKEAENVLLDLKTTGRELPVEVAYVTIVETHTYRPENLHEFLGSHDHPVLAGH